MSNSTGTGGSKPEYNRIISAIQTHVPKALDIYKELFSNEDVTEMKSNIMAIKANSSNNSGKEREYHKLLGMIMPIISKVLDKVNGELTTMAADLTAPASSTGAGAGAAGAGNVSGQITKIFNLLSELKSTFDEIVPNGSEGNADKGRLTQVMNAYKSIPTTNNTETKLKKIQTLQRLASLMVAILGKIQITTGSQNVAVSGSTMRGIESTIRLFSGITANMRREATEALQAANDATAVVEEKAAALEAEKQAVQAALDALRTSSQQEINAAKAQARNANQQAATNQVQIGQLRTELQTLGTEHNALKASILQERDGMSQIILAKEQEIRQLQANKTSGNTAKVQEITALQAELTTLRNQKAAVEQRLADAAATHVAEANELKAQITTLEASRTTNAQTITNQATQITALEARVAALTTEAEALRLAATTSNQASADRAAVQVGRIHELTSVLNQMIMMYNDLKSSYSKINSMVYLEQLSVLNNGEKVKLRNALMSGSNYNKISTNHANIIRKLKHEPVTEVLPPPPSPPGAPSAVSLTPEAVPLTAQTLGGGAKRRVSRLSSSSKKSTKTATKKSTKKRSTTTKSVTSKKTTKPRSLKKATKKTTKTTASKKKTTKSTASKKTSSKRA